MEMPVLSIASEDASKLCSFTEESAVLLPYKLM